ncbi:hypothetical protein PAHAL_8G213500 [Panicum hallii]|uniref:Uncharacterized protein n=1 Tax=Panicum hallii TaxID=206008 RepID=A0A2T8I9Q7_9POAL|nr:hypothetical protein PAHAL_8G213500 [Panicum hallii]
MKPEVPIYTYLNQLLPTQQHDPYQYLHKGRKININMGGRYIELIFQYLKGPGNRNASSAYNSESTTVTQALCPSSCSFLTCNGLPTNIYLPQ